MNPFAEHKDPFRRLVAIMARLRAEGGCPWDREQTHKSLKPYLIEEAHEVCEAIDSGNDDDIRSELGDLLLQPVFHAQIAAEEGRFSIDDALTSISDKLIRRHPHVFGDVEATTSEAVLKNWRSIKEEERRETGNSTPSQLDGVPKALPALMRAQRTQERAAEVGFDWPSAQEAFEKILEETAELQGAVESNNQDSMRDELGDLLFSVVNVCRHWRFDAESLLREATARFEKRFREMERAAGERNLTLREMTDREMDDLWTAAKRVVG